MRLEHRLKGQTRRGGHDPLHRFTNSDLGWQESDKSRGLGQSPVKLFDARLGFRFLRLLNSITRDVQLEDYAVVNKTVDRRSRRHGVFEDAFPLRKWQVARDQNAASLIAFGQQCEEHFHFLATLLYVAEIIDDQSFKVSQLFDEAADRRQLKLPANDN